MTIERQRTTNVVIVTLSPEEERVLRTGSAPPGGTTASEAALAMMERIWEAQWQGVPIEVRVEPEGKEKKVTESC